MIRSFLRLLFGGKKTPDEKARMMFSLKIARSKIFDRVYLNLPEQLRNSDKIGRAIAEQINYATASPQFVGDEAANEIAKAVDMRPHYLALAASIMR